MSNVYDTDTFRWTDILLGIFFFLALVGLGLAIAILSALVKDSE